MDRGLRMPLQGADGLIKKKYGAFVASDKTYLPSWSRGLAMPHFTPQS